MFWRRNRSNNAGFTLIELTIFLGVAGLLASMALNEYSQFKQEKMISDTKARRDFVTQSLSAFVGNFNRLPCPADPALAPTDVLSGLEQCLPAGAVGVPVVPVCGGQVCRTPGYRDTDVDADIFPDPVLIGSVPYITLGLTHQETMDGWGSTFTYAVSEYMTVFGKYNDNNGVVRKMFRSITPPVGAILPELAVVAPAPTANAFLIALISHGKDRKGGYSYYGDLIAPCDIATPSRDAENCDGDAEFISADPKTGIYSLVPGTEYFDDAFSVFGITRDGDKWIYTSGNTMQNKTGGNVGIGLTVPGVKLDVLGNIFVSQSYKTDQYCDKNGNNCFDPDIIAGFGINCGNSLMTGVSSSDVICANKVNGSLILPPAAPCVTGVLGFNAGGTTICAP